MSREKVEFFFKKALFFVTCVLESDFAFTPKLENLYSQG